MAHVTAVIPAYNGVSRYLEAAIRSVLGQTYRDWDLVVVDDASSDGTEQLVRRWPGVTYIRRGINGGQAAARNEGARAAAGQYLAFLDQDDLWEPTFLEEVVSVADEHLEAALIHADGYQVSESNAILEYDGAMKHTASITQMLRGGHDTATSGSLIRRRCFEAVGGYDPSLRVWEDIDLGIKLYRRYPIIHYAKPLYRHRLYGHNASRDIPSAGSLAARERFLTRYAHLCPPGTAEARALRRDWAQYFGDLGKHLLRHGEVIEAREALWQAVTHDPMNRKLLLRFLRSYAIRRGSTV